MDFVSWVKTAYENGELFFYVIPAFLLIMLAVVIFIPEKKEKKGLKPIDNDKKEDEKPREPLKTIDLTKGAGPFKTIEIELEEDKSEKQKPETREIQPATIEKGLEKTRSGFVSRLKDLFKSSVVDDAMMEELEEILFTSDMGVETVAWLVGKIKENKSSFKSGDEVKDFIKNEIKALLKESHREMTEYHEKPAVFLMVGVNGAGKTTTIGKMAEKFVSQGRTCVLAAADTFRAAAVEQLKVWGERTGCNVISDRDGADPASVAYNAINSGISHKSDLVIIDTAGRLQNRVNLMEELAKVKRVVEKAKEGAPHETILVIDANTGSNALSQAKQFKESVNVTGIVVTKLDGTAKGGVVIGIARELKLPVYFVGIGESTKDLEPFDPDKFTEALFS